MNITHFVNELQHQLEVAAGASSEESRVIAERLISSLEATTRLVLLEVLSAAASEITRELAPGSVEVRLRGRDPEFVVIAPPSSPDYEEVGSRYVATPPANPNTASLGDEGGTWRTTLRLPDSLKLQIEEAAANERLSLNSWLVRAVTDALEPKEGRARHNKRFTGWVS